MESTGYYPMTVWTKSAIGLVNADWAGYVSCVYQNKLYMGVGNLIAATDNTAAKILVYDGSNWSVITKATMGGTSADTNFYSMCVYQDKLYIGTYNTTAATDNTGAKILVYDGSNWSVITKAMIGAVNADVNMYSMGVYNDKLYIGTDNATAATDNTAAKILVYDGSNWSVVTKATMGGTSADTILTGCYAHKNKLYVGTRNITSTIGSTGAKLLVYDGSNWSMFTKSNLNIIDNATTELTSFVEYDKYLVTGLKNGGPGLNQLFCCFMTVAEDGTLTSQAYNALNGIHLCGSPGGTAGLHTIPTVYNDKLYLMHRGWPGTSHYRGAIYLYNGLSWNILIKNYFSQVEDKDVGMTGAAVYNNQFFFMTVNSNASTNWQGAKIIAIG